MAVRRKAIHAPARSSACAVAQVDSVATPLTTALAAVKRLMDLAHLRLGIKSRSWESADPVGAIRLAPGDHLVHVAVQVDIVAVLISTVLLETAIQCLVPAMEGAPVR